MSTYNVHSKGFSAIRVAAIDPKWMWKPLVKFQDGDASLGQSKFRICNLWKSSTLLWTVLEFGRANARDRTDIIPLQLSHNFI